MNTETENKKSYIMLISSILQDNAASCFDFDIMQGEAIKRDGTMHVHVKKEQNEPKVVQITGNAVIAFSTEISMC